MGCQRGENRGIHGLQTRRTREGFHEPLVDALLMERVHAGKEANALARLEVDHADGTFVVLHISTENIGWNLIEKSADSILFRFVQFLAPLLGLPLSNYIVLVELIHVRTTLRHHRRIAEALRVF